MSMQSKLLRLSVYFASVANQALPYVGVLHDRHPFSRCSDDLPATISHNILCTVHLPKDDMDGSVGFGSTPARALSGILRADGMGRYKALSPQLQWSKTLPRIRINIVTRHGASRHDDRCPQSMAATLWIRTYRFGCFRHLDVHMLPQIARADACPTS
ncbi:hypothetical protein BDU57DRAFT_67660 [Ampelomyces quisqualis]|uniref:Uncharacterized protein n=1 Tax=Ampelomyces quisqualis TaxID=50730 RepID=A0A6A5R432_AMPQU|nr:hypothetical protein BDU57DRAFT_67660 [Ampelomyces quisqualis]